MSKVKVKVSSVSLRGGYAPLEQSYNPSTFVIIESDELVVLPKLDDAGADTGDTYIYTGGGAFFTSEESIATFDVLVSATDGSETT